MLRRIMGNSAGNHLAEKDPKLAAALTTFASQLIGVISMVFWFSLAVAILIRVIIAFRHRMADSVRRGVLKPFASSAAVMSEIYGWKHSDSDAALIVTQQGESSTAYPSKNDDDGEGDGDGDGDGDKIAGVVYRSRLHRESTPGRGTPTEHTRCRFPKSTARNVRSRLHGHHGSV